MTQSPQFDISTIIRDGIAVITDPARFYRGMAREGGFADPAIYVLVMGAAAGLLATLLSLFGAGWYGGMGSGMTLILLVPLALLIWSFIGAAVLFVVWKLMGSEQPYEVAYRCAAYATAIVPATMPLQIFPYLPAIVSVTWGSWLMVLASVEVHRLEQKKALLVFGILGLLSLLWNLGAERTTRALEQRFGDMAEQMGGIEGLEKMSPEEAGRAMGEFMRGFEQGSQPKEGD